MTWHSRAPARIDFGGGWTDVPEYADHEGGIVVNAAINCYVTVDVLTGGRGISLHAEDLGVHVRYGNSGDIRYDGKLDLHKAALNMFPVTGGVEVLSRSQLPHGSGLGSSGALDVALVAALSRARGEWYDRRELAELGFQLEHVELGLQGGRQDQYAAAFGGFLELEFARDIVRVRPIDIPVEQADDLARHMVLLYAGESHFSSQTHERVWTGYRERRPAVLDALHVIKEVGCALPQPIRDANWREVARLMNENWRQQQRLDPTISTTMTQTVERAVREAGAWGAKATGAGAGGCFVVMCSPDARERVITAAAGAGATTLEASFDFNGVETGEEDAGGDAG